MSRIQYSFNIVAILLASVLVAVGISNAHAGSKPNVGGSKPSVSTGSNRLADPAPMGRAAGASGTNF